MKVAVDSNVLLYLARLHRVEGDQAKSEQIDRLLLRLNGVAEIMAPLQALGECYFAMARKGFSREDAREVVLGWLNTFTPIESDMSIFLVALELATDHKLQFWDALILNAAADAGCTVLLSEDMQSGFSWRGVTVVNPFAAKPHPKLARLLAS